MLKEVANSMPGFAACANFCYSRHILLFYDKFVMSSESGVQQSDTVDPMLFFTLWPIIEKNQEMNQKLQQNSCYLDNDVLKGSEDNLIGSWNILGELGPDSGL